jgi:hypothetical protein
LGISLDAGFRLAALVDFLDPEATVFFWVEVFLPESEPATVTFFRVPVFFPNLELPEPVFFLTFFLVVFAALFLWDTFKLPDLTIFLLEVFLVGDVFPGLTTE